MYNIPSKIRYRHWAERREIEMESHEQEIVDRRVITHRGSQT